MLKKLKLALRNQRGLPLLLAGEVLLAGSACWWWIMTREPLAALIWIAVAVGGYVKPFFQTRQFLASFLIVLGVSLTIPYKNILVALYIAIVYGLLIGIKNLIFLERKSIYYLTSGLLTLLIGITFFSIDKTEIFIIPYILTGVAFFMLAREFFVIFGVYEAQGIAGVHETEALELNFFENRILAKKNFIAFVVAFVMMELLWGILLLPIGFLNSAALALVAALLIENLSIHYVSGTFSRAMAFKKIGLLVVLWGIIALASRWTL